MFSKLREPFGTAGLVVAIVALVFALGGGAWALTASVSGKHHRHPHKSKRHARGIRGPQGPLGPEGPEGPPGVNGKNGVNGKAGVNGTNGVPGRSVVSGEEPTGPNCASGGYWFEIQGTGSKQYVCNGGGGSGGSGGTLAPGQTLTGVWATHIPPGAGAHTSEAVSFPSRVDPMFEEWAHGGEENMIGLVDPLGGSCCPHGSLTPTAKCPGSWNLPAAAPGQFCVYLREGSAHNLRPPVVDMDVFRKFGTVLNFQAASSSEFAEGRGTWAVTAACETC
jgi:hypothetical protein